MCEHHPKWPFSKKTKYNDLPRKYALPVAMMAVLFTSLHNNICNNICKLELFTAATSTMVLLWGLLLVCGACHLTLLSHESLNGHISPDMSLKNFCISPLTTTHGEKSSSRRTWFSLSQKHPVCLFSYCWWGIKLNPGPLNRQLTWT